LGFTFICGRTRRGGFLIHRNPTRPHAGDASRDQGGIATANA
jgi:hypothetical protein